MQKKRSLPTDLETLVPLLIGVWRRFRKESGPSDVLQTREFRSVVAAVKTLQSGLEIEKNLLNTDYFSDRELLGAYLLYQWVLHYLQGLSVINELPTTPNRVLDLCSGPAPLAFAALRHGANNVFALDRNQQALDLGSEVCGRYGAALTFRKTDCLKNPFPDDGKFDLITLGYCLEELFPKDSPQWEQRQQTYLKTLLNRLTPQGYLLIVDSSYLETNRRLLKLRDDLVASGVPVQAPCVWKGPCPALQTKDSPCYAQREFEKPPLIKEIQRAAEINLSSLKMTYLIFRSPKVHWPVLEEENCYRVISPPVETYQGKRYYLCGHDGKSILGSHLNEHPVESRAFEYLKRGELISIKGALERNNAFDIVQGTTLKVVAPIGKPLPEKEKLSEDNSEEDFDEQGW